MLTNDDPVGLVGNLRYMSGSCLEAGAFFEMNLSPADIGSKTLIDSKTCPAYTTRLEHWQKRSITNSKARCTRLRDMQPAMCNLQ